jgi:RNA polymerase sigma-70 factor (ECF subfamily)
VTSSLRANPALRRCHLPQPVVSGGLYLDPRPRTHDWRSRSASSLPTATWTKRAIGLPASSRIAYQYLRDAAEADEAVQDAFVKAFGHIASYREAWPFEVWFTRILINGCLDRRKARARRDRWFAPSDDAPHDETRVPFGGVAELDPVARLRARERRARLSAAIDRLDGRQRTVFMLCHYGDCTPREVSAMTGLNESTVRVHLFRAARKLRALLGAKS